MNLKQEFKKATIVFAAITLVFFIIHYFFGHTINTALVRETLITNAVFSYAFYFANLFLVELLDKWMPWNPKPFKRAIIGTILTIIVNFIIVCLAITFVTMYAYGGDADYIFTNKGKGNVIITFVIVTFITMIFYTAGFFKEVQEQKLLNEKLRKEKISAQLNALKSQIDPHFLFNSFNVLSGLIDENPQQAQKFLSGLSKIYRYVLENRNEDLVSLGDELKFANQYLALQKIRFENSINLDLNVEESLMEMQIPALSLQLLLENAVTHNRFDTNSPLHISIESIDQVLVVGNNKQERNKLASGNGIGLKNIKERYQLQKINGFKIEDIDQSFIVHLPLIPK
jgi:sensor histidine kinase YesM